MLKTILIGSCVYVQGVFVRKLGDGKIIVRVGDRLYKGMPITSKLAA